MALSEGKALIQRHPCANHEPDATAQFCCWRILRFDWQQCQSKVRKCDSCNQLGGTATALGTMGLLTAGSFVYGIMKKRPQELQLGYVLAGAKRYTSSCLRSLVEWRQKIRWIDKPGFVPDVHFIGCAPLIGMFAGSDPWKPSYVRRAEAKFKKEIVVSGPFCSDRQAKGDHKSGKTSRKRNARQTNKTDVND